MHEEDRPRRLTVGAPGRLPRADPDLVQSALSTPKGPVQYLREGLLAKEIPEASDGIVRTGLFIY
jgi:hypothetical protein